MYYACQASLIKINIFILTHALLVNYGQNVVGKWVVFVGTQQIVGRIGKVWLYNCEYKSLYMYETILVT
jgi:hypothetical protein